MTLAGYAEQIGQIRTSTATDSRTARVGNNLIRWGVSTYVPPTTYGTNEWLVRGAGSVAMLCAVGVQAQLYDPALSQVPSFQTVINRANALVTSAINGHKLFTTGGWGAQWQSAWWATLLGTAGWIQWRYLSATDREHLLGVLEFEADQRLTQPPRYLRNAAGTVLTPGDTGAEENAWNACGLVVASLMMPAHPHAADWMTAAVQLAVSSFAHPADVASAQVVSGRALSAWLGGSNVETDYSVVNHGKVNPDYSQAICLPGHAALLFGLAGKSLPEAFGWNTDRVYAKLTTYYNPGEPAQPVTYPQGPDWGVRRSLSCWWPDMCAEVLGWDALASRPAGYWADVHLADVDAQQARFTDGHLYAPPNTTQPELSEDSYQAREQVACYQLAAGHLMRWLAGHGRLRTTAAAF